MKDAGGKVTAMAQSLSGFFAADEVMKGSLASYTFEHMEIASYTILIAAAESLGETEVRAGLRRQPPRGGRDGGMVKRPSSVDNRGVPREGRNGKRHC
ncbi:DUF892 family protein [Mesorhizobium sp. M0700]